MLKILQARLQQYVNHELPDVQAWFRKGRGIGDQIANIHWTIKKAREFQKTSTSASLTMPKSMKLSFQEMGKPDHLICLLRNLYAGQEVTAWIGHGTTDWSKLGKEYIKVVYCQPAYLTYMQSTSCNMPGWMKQKLESRLPGGISITSDTDDTTLMAESKAELKSL